MATARKAKAPGQQTTRRLAPLTGVESAPSVMRSVSDDGLAQFAGNFPSERIGLSRIVLADCFDWLAAISENSLHAIITDPPYGVKEYEADQMAKRAKGRGGVWRIPPAFDGHLRAPLPRFTALNDQERAKLHGFFVDWARLATRALRPGGHVFIASNAFLSQFVFSALVEGGLEFRGELIRLVRTLRGGDRPKNAEEEFADVCSLPRGCYEPWGILRKPLPAKMTVSECLRIYQTGGLRRTADGRPFADVILSERTPRRERAIADHPSLKPQSFLRQVVHAALPLGVGVIADPFMGSGSTVAAAEALGVQCIGVERIAEYYALSQVAIPQLAALAVASAPELGMAATTVPGTSEQDIPKQLELLLS
ncbi:MAG TPA: DNA methyltransferase [Ktedonobacterales bacterium]|nr:DNA methyltransferase [Ktedonobacterales bacterium]